jgi:plastocyanin
MRKQFLLLITTALFALATAGQGIAATSVSITPTGFSPTQATIGSGDTVTWTNNDTVDRSVVADSRMFASPTLRPGASYTFRFTRVGSFSYHDGTRTAERASITVRATGAAAVTIAATQRNITMGGRVELSGTVTSGRGGQQVTVVGKPYRGAETRQTVLTDPDGTWQLVVRPRIRTEYQAETGNTISSESPVVYVRPAVQLRVRNARTGRFWTKVNAQRSYRGKLVTVQRLRGNTWVKVRRVRLGRSSAVTFTARLPRTARMRVLVPSSPGYLQGFSRTALVRR